jgi:GNAT superfamily N-acetyltransferase
LATGSDEETWLSAIEVDEGFQKQGIGTELVRLAVKHLEDFFIPGVQESDDYAFSLSTGGANLINACLRRGFINEALILFPPEVPVKNGVEVDPGLIIGFGRIGDIYTQRMREQDRNDLSDDARFSP